MAILFFANRLELCAQQRISGFVRDSVSGERLIGATVYDIENQNGTITDEVGFFSLIVKPDATLRVSFIGYESKFLSATTLKDEVRTIVLKSSATALKGAEVVADIYHRPTFNISKLTTEEIVNIPSLTGKPDVLKALQLLPGIRSQGEAQCH